VTRVTCKVIRPKHRNSGASRVLWRHLISAEMPSVQVVFRVEHISICNVQELNSLHSPVIAPSNMDRIFGNGSISSRSEATWKPEPLERGTYSILSSCLVTLGLCVWTAIHLNVPEQNGRLAQILRKLGWMLLAFIAPELVGATSIHLVVNGMSRVNTN